MRNYSRQFADAFEMPALSDSE